MTTTFRIAAVAWLLVSALLLSAQSHPTYNIGRPTILAFFTPASQSEPKTDSDLLHAARNYFALNEKEQ